MGKNRGKIIKMIKIKSFSVGSVWFVVTAKEEIKTMSYLVGLV